MARERRSAAEWKQVVDAWTRSGESRRHFAERHDLHPATLGWWCWKLAQDDQPGFIEVELLASPEIVIEVGDLRVRVPAGFDAAELRRVVDALC